MSIPAFVCMIATCVALLGLWWFLDDEKHLRRRGDLELAHKAIQRANLCGAAAVCFAVAMWLL